MKASIIESNARHVATLTIDQLGELASCGPFLGASTERTLRALGVDGVERWAQAYEAYSQAMRALDEQFEREPEVADADFFAPDTDAVRNLKDAADEARDAVESAWAPIAGLVEVAARRHDEITGGI